MSRLKDILMWCFLSLSFGLVFTFFLMILGALFTFLTPVEPGWISIGEVYLIGCVVSAIFWGWVFFGKPEGTEPKDPK